MTASDTINLLQAACMGYWGGAFLMNSIHEGNTGTTVLTSVLLGITIVGPLLV